MTNRREQIPTEAGELAKRILARCNELQDSPDFSPLKIFAKELELAMLKAYDAGRKIGERVASVKRN